MPCNVEIKARLLDRASVEARAAALSDAGPQVIPQEDYFFTSVDARLKLRVLSPEAGELIRYQRSNQTGARRSNYSIARTSDPLVLRDILTSSLGSAGIVRKMRTLYTIGQTRVHLDEVEGLGDYLELEVVLGPEQDEAEGMRIAEALLDNFGITKDQLVGEAYVDLLFRRVPPPQRHVTNQIDQSK